MNKKNLLMSLFAMIIAIFSLATFTSCKDDNEDEEWTKIYPSEENYNPFEITNVTGIIKYDSDLKSYIFSPNNTKDIYPNELGFEGGSLVVSIKNEKLQGVSKENTIQVCITGIVKYLYTAVPKKNGGALGYFKRYYSLEITNLSINAKSQTRATSENLNFNPNGYDEEPKDSLEILKANKISKYIKRI